MQKTDLQQVVADKLHEMIFTPMLYSEDMLRPGFQGMTVYHLAGQILDAIRFADMPQNPDERPQTETEAFRIAR